MAGQKMIKGRMIFPILASAAILVSMSVTVFAAMRPADRVRPHHRFTQPAPPARHADYGAHPAHAVPWPRVLTDLVISIGTKFMA